MAVAIVDFFQTIEIEEEHGETAAGAARALEFALENFEHLAMIRQARHRIKICLPADLIEEPGIVEERAPEDNDIAQDNQAVRERIRRIQHTARFGHCEIAEHAENGRNKERAVE